jgi:hypothetical protein
MLEVAKFMTMRRSCRRVVVLEGLLQAMTVSRRRRIGLRRRGHHDVRVAVTVVAMSAVGVLDDFEQPVHVRFRILLVTVPVLVIVPMRHLSMLGERRTAAAEHDQAHRPSGRLNQQRPCLRDGLLQRAGLNDRWHQAVEE